MMDLISYRERFPWKPYQHAILDGVREVEIISYPYPEGDEAGYALIRVRAIPGDPTTMIEVYCSQLSELPVSEPGECNHGGIYSVSDCPWCRDRRTT